MLTPAIEIDSLHHDHNVLTLQAGKLFWSKTSGMDSRASQLSSMLPSIREQWDISARETAALPSWLQQRQDLQNKSLLNCAFEKFDKQGTCPLKYANCPFVQV